MKTLTVRGLDEDVFRQFAQRARQQQRNPEAHVRFLIEREALGTAETCGELLDAYADAPPPNVDPDKIDSYLATRGRRSNRP